MQAGAQNWLQGDATAPLETTANKNIARHRDSGGLYFWDETGAEAFGPYPDLRSCLQGIERYVQHLNGDLDGTGGAA